MSSENTADFPQDAPTALGSIDPADAQLSAHDVNYDYDGTPVLKGIDLTLSAGSVLGLVGDNGAGKSSLLWVLSGRRKPTSGTVSHIGTRVLGAQELQAPFKATGQMLIDEALGPSLRRLEELESAAQVMAEAVTDDAAEKASEAYSKIFSDVTAHDDWNAEHNASVILDQLGLSGDGPSGRLLDQVTTEMSGGQRARLGLALTLIRRPDILLLDEPTNHLDDRGRQLVIDTLASHPGIAVVATHDRDFLDEVCTHIGDLVVGRAGIHLFQGNYSEYDKHRRKERDQWEKQWRDQERERRKLEETIDSAGAEKSESSPEPTRRDNDKISYNFSGSRAERQISRRIRAARHKLSVLEDHEIDKPPAILGLDAPLTAPLPKRRVASGAEEDFAIKLRSVVVPDRIRVGSLTIRPGDKVVITGANGAGKSSLLSAIYGELPVESGQIRIGENQRMGWLRQEQKWDSPTKSAEELYGLAPNPAVSFDDLGLLSPDDASRPVGTLSVGQQRRVALGLIVANPPEILLLDEPTNHLSVDLIEEVQDAIGEAEGTIVVVTHDKRMVDRLEARHIVVDNHEVTELPRGQKPTEFA